MQRTRYMISQFYNIVNLHCSSTTTIMAVLIIVIDNVKVYVHIVRPRSSSLRNPPAYSFFKCAYIRSLKIVITPVSRTTKNYSLLYGCHDPSSLSSTSIIESPISVTTLIKDLRERVWLNCGNTGQSPIMMLVDNRQPFEIQGRGSWVWPHSRRSRRVGHHCNVRFCSCCRNVAAQSDCSVQVLKAWLINERASN